MSGSKSIGSKKDGAVMKSRVKPVSTSRPQSRGSNSKISDDVHKENIHLKDQLAVLQEENNELKDKLRTLSLTLVDAGRLNGVDADFDMNSDILEIPLLELLNVIADLKKSEVQLRLNSSSKDLEENRLEDLETRVTFLNTEIAKLVKLKLRVENGLYEIDRCKDYEQARQKAKYLWYESCGTQIFVTPKTEVETEVSAPDGSETVKQQETTELRQVQNVVHNGMPASPPGKLPADTHVRDLHKGLLQLITQELSLYKGNGADWRMFADRVGVPAQLINQWKTMKLPQPMKNVLFVWGESPGATVRMLHRHLASPQLKCVILAKRLSDFYEVD